MAALAWNGTAAAAVVCGALAACGSTGAASSGGAANDSPTGTGSGVTSSGSGGAPASTGSGGHLAASALVFAVVGDSRPPIPDDVIGYPKAVVQQIFTRIAALDPAPSFVVATGDYQYSDPFTGLAAQQLDFYLAAKKAFAGPLYPAMGNHECNGLATSNCGQGNADGVTAIYSAFVAKMLTPIGQKSPYYTIHESAGDGTWTAKLVFVAANAWSSEQAKWLDVALSEPTTYTFVVRHEPAATKETPGVPPSEQIMAKHPYTLALTGHTHTFRRSGPREVIVGNGGAPLTEAVNYGFGLVTRRQDGAIQVAMIDYQTGKASQQFAVNADGSAAP